MPYHNLDEIESGLRALATRYPTTCRLLDEHDLPYLTEERRTTYAVRVGTDGDRPAVLLAGGHHANEWVPPEVCMSLAADLLEAYDEETGLSYGGAYFTFSQVRQIIETFHLYIVPTCNPDGFHYSKEHDSVNTRGADDALPGWRRNRNPADSGDNPACIGVDLNRNYHFLWDFRTKLSPDADLWAVSDDPCALNQTYHGSAPNSEPEARNIIWLLDNIPRIRWFFDIHSFSERIMYNWGHDQSQTTDPDQSFANPAYDGVRGVEGDSYREYIDARDLDIYQSLAEEIRQGIEDTTGRDYTVQSAFALYPTTGSSADYSYARHIVDPTKLKVYSFGLEIGSDTLYFRPQWGQAEEIISEVSSGLLRFLVNARCITWPITVTPPDPLEINFFDIPEGLTTYRAIVFEVRGCGPASVRAVSGPTVTSGPPDTTFYVPPVPPSEPADPGIDFESPAYARVWIAYTGTAPSDVATGTVRVRCDETEEEWEIAIRANTVARETAAVVLALDQSGSMDDPAGDLGALRIEVLREAAARFVELIPANSAVGLIRFDHDAYPVDDPTYPGLAVTHIDTDEMADVGRSEARAAVRRHNTNPDGYTSIGDGVVMARNLLAPVSGYTNKAMIVFTDGIENRDALIATVMDSIDQRTFAIGLGTETQVSTAGLMALAGGRNGYLLLTGHLTTETDDYFRLTKYFHQILAGITRTDIVRDPSGRITPGAERRIPFVLTEADVETTVILLTDMPAVHLFVETPSGDLLDPGTASALGATFAVGSNMRFYRFGLPLPVGKHAARAGTWHAILKVDESLYMQYLEKLLIQDKDRAATTKAHGVRYNLSIHSYSNIHMRTRVDQSGLEPGAELFLRAVLSEYDLPVEDRARVVAEIERPDKTGTVLPLTETEPGVFESSVIASMSGLYRVLIRGEGKTRRGRSFTREQQLTAAVFQGGDVPLPSNGKEFQGGKEALCDLIECLLRNEAISKFLEQHGIDPITIHKCLARYCSNHPRRIYEHTGDGPARDDKIFEALEQLLGTTAGQAVLLELCRSFVK